MIFYIFKRLLGVVVLSAPVYALVWLLSNSTVNSALGEAMLVFAQIAVIFAFSLWTVLVFAALVFIVSPLISWCFDLGVSE